MFEALAEIVGSGNVRVNVPLSAYTTFRIGGCCDYFVTPHKAEEIPEILAVCKKESVPWFVIGKGSNLLVSDDGFRGVIICLADNFDSISITGNVVRAAAGTKLITLSNTAAKAGLSGLEFAAGIPGTVGGAVIMNAGAYGGDISQVIVSALCVDDDHNLVVLDREGLELEYRSSLPGRKGWIVLEAVFELTPGDIHEILAKMQDVNTKRREKQPLEFPNAGSIFKRPKGYFAGKLIQDAGLSGVSVGGAMVSPKHNGFIINTGNAKASDVRQLISLIQKTVYDHFGVQLETEVKFLGF
jgi:UDP-N-acetylmuramate dehydrogenase